jgi:alkylation response protein AidB-like acyl-CoA dehydrogenase
VRPLVTIDEEHEVNEVFFDNVKVPPENLIGVEGKGWTYAKYLLGHERTGITGVGASKRELTLLKEFATTQTKGGKPLAEDPIFRTKVAQLEIDLMALETTLLRVLSNRDKPGPEASILKIKGTEVQQGLTELMMEALGPYAEPFSPHAIESGARATAFAPDHAGPIAARYFAWRKTSIYGGSNEIQRNIIAQMVLGL